MMLHWWCYEGANNSFFLFFDPGYRCPGCGDGGNAFATNFGDAHNTRRAAAHIDAQTPVHTHTAHNDNTTTSIERSAPTPPKGKRLLISTNDLPSPPSAKRKTENTTTKAKKTTSSAREKKENPTSDALLLAFEDPTPAPRTSPFSEELPRALALDHEPSADLPGFLSVPRATLDSFPLAFPDDGNDEEVFLPTLDDLMADLAPQRTLRSSRSTDAKSSETPVVDDVLPSSNSSPGKKQRATKKTRLERWESSFSLVSLSFGLTIRKNRRKF